MFRSLSLLRSRHFSTASLRKNVLDGPIDKESVAAQASLKFSEFFNEQHAQAVEFSRSGGSEKARALHVQRNKLLPRDRVRKLLDSDDWLELAPFAAMDVYPEGPMPSAGIITGIGKVANQRCVIIANDATIKGGTYFTLTGRKHLRAQEIAWQNGLPCIYVVDSGGGYLPYQAQGFADRDHFGRVFYNQANMSAQSIPQIGVVVGSCTAGGAYIPAMCDESVMVQKQSFIYLGGPPLVFAATGEKVTSEQLGGADVHCDVSGLTDHKVDSDDEAMLVARDIVRHLPLTDYAEDSLLKRTRCEDDPEGIGGEPLACHPAEDLNACMPLPRQWVAELVGEGPAAAEHDSFAWPARAVLARILDGSFFHEFRRTYAPTLLTGFGWIGGMPVGIVANDGPLTAPCGTKGAMFLQVCNQRGIPVVFLMNLSGRTDETTDPAAAGGSCDEGAFAKEVGKMISAVSCSGVPLITVVCGGCHGIEAVAMAAKQASPRFFFAWPSARISWEPQESLPTALGDFKKLPSVQHAMHMWVDDLILPADTRRVLIQSLRTVCVKPPAQGGLPVYRM